MLRISLFKTVVATATLLMIADSAFALRIAIRTKDATAQTLEADAIIVGKVMDLEKTPVNATLNEFPNAPKVDYQVATIKISEGLQGTKGLTTIRVGWQLVAMVDPAPATPQPAVRPAIVRPLPGRGVQVVALSEGQEGCFFLKKHHAADFYIIVPNGRPLDKKAENFEQELDQVKKIVKVFESPVNALKAKELSDRQLAANVLVRKYRTGIPTTNGQPAKQEEIPAEESKLILQIVSEMDWNNTGGAFDPKKIYASQVFYQLGIPQGQEGYTPPKFEQGQDYNKIIGEYTTKWLKDNAEKYRIKKFVAEKK